MINVSIQKVLQFETQPDQSFPNLGSESVTCCLANPTNFALLNMVCQGSTCIFSDQPQSQFCCTTNDWQALSFTESSTWTLPTPDWMKTPLASSLSLLKPSNVKPKKEFFWINVRKEILQSKSQSSSFFFFLKQLYKHFIVIVSNDNVAIWKVSLVVMKRIVNRICISPLLYRLKCLAVRQATLLLWFTLTAPTAAGSCFFSQSKKCKNPLSTICSAPNSRETQLVTRWWT